MSRSLTAGQGLEWMGKWKQAAQLIAKEQEVPVYERS